MNIMHYVTYGLKIEKTNWQDICINKKRNGMNIPVSKKISIGELFSEAITFWLKVFLTPVPKLTNRTINKARLMHSNNYFI